jgi:hypothetical protein
MAKKRRGSALGTAALLGGAALLASRMMKGKGDKEGKKDTDTTADASAGMAKDRLGGIGLDRGDMDTSGDASAGMARDRLADLERAGATTRTPTRASAPTRAAVSPRASEVPPPMSRTEEGAMASGMPREARGVERTTPSFSSLGGMTMREKMAAMRGQGMKKGGSVKAKPKMSSASKRADGCAMKGKTRGKMI